MKRRKEWVLQGFAGSIVCDIHSSAGGLDGNSQPCVPQICRCSMPFALLRRAAKLRGYSMPSLSNKVVESADSPASTDDYIRLKGLRLVIFDSKGSFHAAAITPEKTVVAGQALLLRFPLLCQEKMAGDDHNRCLLRGSSLISITFSCLWPKTLM